MRAGQGADVLAGFKGAVQEAGYDTVSTPTEWAYSNYYQSEEAEGEPLATGGLTPLEKVYAFEPVPPGLSPERARQVLGGRGSCGVHGEP